MPKGRLLSWVKQTQTPELSFWVGSVLLATVLPALVVGFAMLNAGRADADTLIGAGQLWIAAFVMIASALSYVLSSPASVNVRLVLVGAFIVLLFAMLPAIYSLTGAVIKGPALLTSRDRWVAALGSLALLVSVFASRAAIVWTREP